MILGLNAYHADAAIVINGKLIALSFWITFRGKWEARDKKV